jgi:MSHA biogenesis protein MshO
MEMVIVIVILGVIGGGMANFIGLGAEVYVEAVGRERMISQTRYMMERLTREVREALPNSVRVMTSSNVSCVEFVPIKASSSYVNVPVHPESATDSISVVQHAVTGLDATKIAIYPLTTTDVYGTNAATATTGNIFEMTAAPSAGTGTETVTLSNSVKFDADSPTQRYYLVKNAVSYCADVSSGTATSGQVKRYADYWPPLSGQEAPPLNATGVLMAENVKSGSSPFSYSTATLVPNAVIQFTLEIVRNGEEVDFHHEVHLVNVP